ncbi:MAG: Asp-tRNA(Asn)/Glu-tRNA(Gln) amidotransferase subunit GatC [Proteobacteria bacterium]|nr:Asp-tRNA(Asn)/Glu-tRNA(Gln) amidotransferase subunit GatC [Pseudomonadota bacterium]
MKIENEDVRKAAEIAKIYLNNEEVESYKIDLEDMTQEFLDVLQSLGIDLDEKFDFTQSSSKRTVLRNDNPDVFEETDKIIKNAPSVKEGLFTVPTILKGEN